MIEQQQIYISSVIRKRLKTLAKKERVSVSVLCENFIKEGLDNKKNSEKTLNEVAKNLEKIARKIEA